MLPVCACRCAGLFEEDKVWAVATAEVSVRAGLQVRSLAIHPAELHQTTSTAYQRMLHGLCRCRLLLTLLFQIIHYE